MQALNLDASTIMVANIMIGFCLTILLSFSLLDHITCPGMRFWSLSFLAWTIGLVCMLSRMYIPLWISVCLGISLIVTGYSLMWLGILQYKKTYSKKHLRVFFILPVLIILLWLLSLHSNDIYFSLRTSNIAIVISLLSLLIFSELITRRKRNETGRLLCAISFFVTVLLMIYRMVSTQYLDVPIKLFDANSSNIILMFGMGFTLLVTGISVLIISSQWLQNRLYVHATYDALTGIYNRYALIELSETLELTANLSSKLWSLIILDIDHFKAVNDRFGHPTGDLVLQNLAQEIKKTSRHCDIVSRYGGEEFVIILPDCNLSDAANWAEKLRIKIEQMEFISEHGPVSFHITVSMGIASATQDSWKLAQVLGRADVALYNAKQSGRNQVKIDQADMFNK